MRKVTLVLLFLMSACIIHAQQDSTLKQYIGKYKFPDGNPVTEIAVTIDNGLLYVTSAMGSSELKKTGEDVFEVVAYSGLATFKRHAETKVVNAIRIEVGQMVMEGSKTEESKLKGIYFPLDCQLSYIRAAYIIK
jgi:hypothetical protein